MNLNNSSDKYINPINYHQFYRSNSKLSLGKPNDNIPPSINTIPNT